MSVATPKATMSQWRGGGERGREREGGRKERRFTAPVNALSMISDFISFRFRKSAAVT